MDMLHIHPSLSSKEGGYIFAAYYCIVYLLYNVHTFIFTEFGSQKEASLKRFQFWLHPAVREGNIFSSDLMPRFSKHLLLNISAGSVPHIHTHCWD